MNILRTLGRKCIPAKSIYWIGYMSSDKDLNQSFALRQVKLL